MTYQTSTAWDVRVMWFNHLGYDKLGLCKKSFGYTVEPRFNDLRSNDIPGLTMEMSLTAGAQNISGYNGKINITDHSDL